ncbi:MAG TPA: hypothetical protein PK530_03725 [Anaerolineales bacterium]|nr:hypothetical protein [Anaerolineales bacterium]
MKKDKEISPEDDMQPEYDFSGGVRGKHFKAYREGHTVTIHKEDGSTIVQEFKLEKNAVVLEPDVKEYFPDSESVNQALRALIALIPEKRKTTSKTRRRTTTQTNSPASQSSNMQGM